MVDLFDYIFGDLNRSILRMIKDDYKFESPIQRTYETYYLNENSFLITLNLLGVSSEDISVKLDSERGFYYLNVNAETKNETLKKTYSYSNKFSLEKTGRKIENVKWEAKDGILYIVITYKEELKDLVEVSNAENLLGSIEVVRAVETEEETEEKKSEGIKKTVKRKLEKDIRSKKSDSAKK